ncbi:MAG: hypothetical protein H7Y38_19320 [Armatimonadetes bacterium]|nr:hypothetical protein [Armatimonadota bacterium]
MTGTMMPLQRSNAVSTVLESTQRIPRTVRCRNCGSLSREEAREQKTGEVTVRYECGYCSQTLTRHYADENTVSH